MKTEQDKKSNADLKVITVVIAIGLAMFIFSMQALAINVRYILFLMVFFSFVVGIIGNTRKIGLPGAFFISLLLSPLIGLVITLSSSKIKDEAYKEKMLELAENKTTVNSVADQLHKLNELRKEGVLTDEEFNEQKEKLLNG